MRQHAGHASVAGGVWNGAGSTLAGIIRGRRNMVRRAEEELKRILCLLAKWRKENGVESVSAWISSDGGGLAYGMRNGKTIFETGALQFEPALNNETPAAGTAGESR